MSIIQTSNFLVAAGLPADDKISVANTTARDAIPSVQRYVGMIVTTKTNPPVTYQLGAGLTNADWTVFGGGGGGSIGGSILTNQVAFGVGVDTIGGSGNYTVDPDTNFFHSANGFDWPNNFTVQRYVDPTGNDANNGLNPLSAWATIQHANDKVEAAPTGEVLNHLAAGTYNETLKAPAQFYGRAVGGGMGPGGSVETFSGGGAVPSDVLISSNDDIFTNDRFDSSCKANFAFDNLKFVGVGNNAAITMNIGAIFIGQVEFEQLAYAVQGSIAESFVIITPATNPLTINNISRSVFNMENGALLYCLNSITATDIGGPVFSISNGASVNFESDQTHSYTSSATPSRGCFNIDSGMVQAGKRNSFTVDGFFTAFEMTGNSTFLGEEDSVFEFTSCNAVANLQDNAYFKTSDDGSATYSVGSGTPSTENFYLDGQASVYNQINTSSGNPEIPMTWFTRAIPLAETNYILATDWRYISPTFTILGELPQNSGFYISSSGLADTYSPIFEAKYNCIFSQVIIDWAQANGPNGPANVTDTYTLYLNNSPTTFTANIGNGKRAVLQCHIVCAPGDTIGLFVATDANTLARDLTIAL